MNFGESLIKLRDSLGIKYFADYGKLVGVSGDWLNDNSKKVSPDTVNITYLIKIAKFHNISLDYFFTDNETKKLTVKGNFDDNDIGTMLDNVKDQIKSDSKFYGFKMKDETRQLAKDSIEVLKDLIKQNI